MSEPKICARCGGTGFMQHVTHDILFTNICEKCNGIGYLNNIEKKKEEERESKAKATLNKIKEILDIWRGNR